VVTRVLARFVGLSCTLAVTLAVVPVAQAHHIRRTALYVDFGSRTLALEIRMPLEELSFARGKVVKLTNWQVDPADAHEIADYVRAHLRVESRSVGGEAVREGKGKGTRDAFEIEIGTVAIQTDNLLVVTALARASRPDATRAIELHYDAITERVNTHETYVFVRRDLEAGQLGDAPKLFGTLHWQRRSIVVDRAPGGWARGFSTVWKLGLSHIQQGTDHLLFLLMLLLPAPLIARNRRWAGGSSVLQCLRTTFGIVTAFTIGHSLTLIAGAVRGVALPVQPVEVLIAVSILVSAVHAFRPVFAGREMFVAGGFGLVHGLAFARELMGFGFDGRSLALALLGFNLGIEAMQLAVVLLVMPWLWIASRSPRYAWLRVPGAAFGVVASTGWIAERAFGVRSQVTVLVEAVAAHAQWLLMGLACLTLLNSAAWFASRHARRRRAPPDFEPNA
jgi:hypothetical protein